ncbi:MAG: FAD-dependent thymidylate synthase [Leptonema sp. (in: Bacteria)]|nr:FAD-dependent thymidylate synthase [Leptonema sp. (in: bacteria)]
MNNSTINVKLLGIDGKLNPTFIEAYRRNQFSGNDYENMLEYAGRICYDSFGKEKSRPSVEYLQHIVESRHTSVLGHGLIHIKWPSENYVKEFVWNYRSEPGWYIYEQVLSVNLRFVERNLSSLYQNYPEIVKLFADRYPNIIETKEVAAKTELNEAATGQHSWLNFEVGCSRSCSHELIRHSFQSSISQRSTRYVNESEFKPILHPIVETLDTETCTKINDITENIRRQIVDGYTTVISLVKDGLSIQGSATNLTKTARGAAARLLPHGLPTKIVYSVSIRELKEIIQQRVVEGGVADLEIYRVALQMKRIAQDHKFF